jgi:hypothetical protein
MLATVSDKKFAKEAWDAIATMRVGRQLCQKSGGATASHLV